MSRCVAVVSLVLIGLVPAPARAQAGNDGGWSPEYRAALRRTVELRQRRRSDAGGTARVGKIVPYPMPPALIIRQTPETHDEIRGLLRVLRGAP
jgi:hypothetical protein